MTGNAITASLGRSVFNVSYRPGVVDRLFSLLRLAQLYDPLPRIVGTWPRT